MPRYYYGQRAPLATVMTAHRATLQRRSGEDGGMRMVELAAEVRAIVALIPPGAVTTYGEIARALGVTPRQVGRAMAILDDAVPWHRVVKADGTPAGCHNGQARELLRAELTPMVGGRIDMREARWDPHPGSGSDATRG